MSAAATPDPGLEAQIEKYRPKRPDDPASGGTLWHLNGAGLLGRALKVEGVKQGTVRPDLNDVVVSKVTAWEVMAEAQRAGVRFGS